MNAIKETWTLDTTLPAIEELRRLRSPAPTPQALAWQAGRLWMGSRDERRIYAINPESWAVIEEREVAGIPWAAVSSGDKLWFTMGEGAEDDRYIREYTPGSGFSSDAGIACPEFTGSYLSHDGEHLYLSQWYEHRILQLSERGEILRAIDVGAEICGHVFVDGVLYALRGTENGPEEQWCLARLDPRERNPSFRDLARVPFACRSLTFDGRNFWANHRATNSIVCFTAGPSGV